MEEHAPVTSEVGASQGMLRQRQRADLSATAAQDEGAAMSKQPVCRQAQQHTVECPVCKRTMTIKSMKYTHRCKRAWDVKTRANEEAAMAIERWQQRMRAATEISWERDIRAGPNFAHLLDGLKS